MAQLVSSYSTFEEGQPARKLNSNSEGPISFLFVGGQFSNFRIKIVEILTELLLREFPDYREKSKLKTPILIIVESYPYAYF